MYIASYIMCKIIAIFIFTIKEIKMDTFFEQLIPIKKGVKTWSLFIGLTVLSVALMAFVLVFLGRYGLIFAFLIAYGAYGLYGKLTIEYEYIVTNDSFDVDKIIGKNSRKRVLSFDIPEILTLERCDFNNIPQGDYAKKIIACNKDDDFICSLTVKTRNGKCLLVFAPNEKIREGILKNLPKHIDSDVLK